MCSLINCQECQKNISQGLCLIRKLLKYFFHYLHYNERFLLKHSFQKQLLQPSTFSENITSDQISIKLSLLVKRNILRKSVYNLIPLFPENNYLLESQMIGTAWPASY